MKVRELIEALTGVDPDAQIMIQDGENRASRYMIAAQDAYFDTAGSKPLVVIDMYGQTDSCSSTRIRLTIGGKGN